MIKRAELPRDPEEAFQTVLSELKAIAESFPQKNLSARMKTDALSYIRMLQIIARRLDNPEDYREPLERAVGAINNSNPSGTLKVLENVEDLFFANTLDKHFIDEDEEYQFNTVAWEEGDRATVIDALSEARRITTSCDDFDDDQKRRVMYWISKAETEVFKTEGKLASILSAVIQIADTAEYVGEKAKPLAKLIAKVKTTTKKNVVEVRQISGPDNRKMLAPPDET